MKHLSGSTAGCFWCWRRQGICVPSSCFLHWISTWWCRTSKWKHRHLYEQPSGPQEWTISSDVRDAYLHVLMHRVVKTYLWFRVNEKTHQFTCLPFRLATSPREFPKLLRPIVAWLRQQSVKLHIYLDDWLIWAESPEQAQMHAQMTISLMQRLGWVINFEKSDLTPSQDFQFLGMHWNTWQFRVALLPKMHLKVQSVHQHWMSNPIISAHNLHRLLDVMVFMAMLVHRGRLRLRPI